MKDLSEAGTKTQDLAVGTSSEDKAVVHDDSTTDKFNTPKQTSPSSEADDGLHGGQSFSLIHEVLFVSLVCSAQLLTQAGLGQALAPLHIISSSYGSPQPGQLAWFIAGYSLTVGTFILIAGRAGDILGHKKLFVAGYLWYGLWSLVAGLSVYSHSPAFFSACRALQGIGPAMLLPNALAILGRTYQTGKRKDMVFALFGATAPNGFILGALFSSLLAELAWWPWAYWILTVVCLLLALSAVAIIPPMPGTGPISLSAFDPLGSLLGVVGLILFNVAWNQAPISTWSSPAVLVPLILGLGLLVAFFFIENHVVAHPLIPSSALSVHNVFILACVGLGWSSFGCWAYYFWQFVETLRGVSPLLGTAQIVPAGISGLFAALTTGYLLSRAPPSTIMSAALLAFFTGNTLLATMPVTQTYWLQTFFSILITPWGMDMSFPAGTVILSDFMPRGQQGLAASLVNTVVNYSISIGLGIAGTVEVHVNEGGKDLLKGYRGALYTGMGLSGMGVLVSGCFIMSELKKRRSQEKDLDAIVGERAGGFFKEGGQA